MSLADPTARIGDNSGDPFALNRADIEQRIGAFMAGADVWSERDTLDDDLAARANDFITGARRLWKEADDARKAEKQPHLDAGRAVDESWAPLLARVEKIVALVKPKVEAFLRAKQEAQRKAEEEARRRQREAEAAARAAAADAAAAQSASARIEAEERAEAAQREAEIAEAQARANAGPARAESATGLANRRGLKTERKAEIVSLAQALAHYRNHPEIEALILKLANADLRHAPSVRGKKQIPNIPGIKWVEEQKL
jgi:hypothetical protein